MLTSNEIRQQFINFFKEKGHVIVKSSPVVPIDDPTLLFTNAGMNQFKDIFLGYKEANISAAVNSQKCIRAGGKHNDLDEVGKDGYHHTFFEMLGNWSFGEYYKKEAIKWAWELFTEVWKLPKDKLHATVYNTDDEAYELWKSETDIDHSHITRHGEKDNFWEMGETGPCGPCSEINLDRGQEFCNLKDDPEHECRVNGDCHRYIELWNLVFMEFQRNEDRSLTPLKKKFVDTGAGFERLCQVLQNKTTNYDTDVFQPLIQEIALISKHPYSEETGVSHRVIADHIRSLTFAIADGGIPSNEGRGYVLRRILRRAARYGRNLGLTDPFMYKLIDCLVEQMGDTFEEIKIRSEFIKMIVKSEEVRFNQTLDNGLSLFQDLIRNLQGNTISGKDAFTLFDTYGFPLDLTKILAAEKNLSVDDQTFLEEMQKQKQKAKSASNFKLQQDNLEWIEFSTETKTEFVGYTQDTCQARILKFAIAESHDVAQTFQVEHNQQEISLPDTTEQIDQSTEINPHIIKLVLDKTPFYAESGGQVADKGIIFSNDTEIMIFNVFKEGDSFVHWGRIRKGTIEDKTYTAQISLRVRELIRGNHTATHLLHAALKKVLGDHVAQKGSLVNAMGIRFDFTHFNAMTPEEIQHVETLVNKQIRTCTPLSIVIKNIEEAKKEGATALFGEKYGDQVRVVTIEDFSKELCGGTHVKNTGQIGYFKIISEASISSGIRRIEAITGEVAEKHIHLNDHILNTIYHSFTANRKNILEKIDKLFTEMKTQQQEINKLHEKNSANIIDDLLNKTQKTNKGINYIAALVNANNTEDLKTMGDLLKQKIKSGIGILISIIDQKVSIIAVVTNDLVATFSAGKIVSQLSLLVDGKGGGRPDMAMGGGKAIEKIDELLSRIPEILG